MTKQRATRLYAVFEELPQVRRALKHLGTDNAEPNNLEIRSMIPLSEDLMPNATELRSRVPLLAILGGVLGGFGAYFLGTHVPTIGSQAAVSGPPVAVFIFEGAALGAVLFSVATVLAECDMPRLRWKPDPFDHHIAAGRIVVAVDTTEDAINDWAADAMATQVRPRD